MCWRCLERLESGEPLIVGNRRLPESVYVVNNTLVKYVYRRHRMGVAFNALVRLLFGLTTRDTQSGLKGFSRSAAARIFQQLYTDGFLFDIEIFIRSRTLGIPVTEVPVQLTYEDDITTVGQFRVLFSVIPELIHIKLLELRGAYQGPRDAAAASRQSILPGREASGIHRGRGEPLRTLPRLAVCRHGRSESDVTVATDGPLVRISPGGLERAAIRTTCSLRVAEVTAVNVRTATPNRARHQRAVRVEWCERHPVGRSTASHGRRPRLAI